MFKSKPMTKYGAVSMSMSVEEYYALLDFFADGDVRDRLLDSSELWPGRTQDENFMKEGYARLMADGLLEVKYDDTIGVHSFNDNDPLISLFAFNVGMIASDASSYRKVEVSYNMKETALVLVNNDAGAWYAIWKTDKETVSLMGGFRNDSLSRSVLDKILPFMNKSNQTGAPFNLVIRRYAMDGSVIMGSSMYGDSNRYHETAPKNAVLLKSAQENASSRTADGSGFMYAGRGAEDRILDLLEVM